MDNNVTADTRELPDISQEFNKQKPEHNVHEIRVQRSRGGLRGRWMTNSLTFLLALLAIITIFVAMISASYYYNSMSENLMSRAVQTASFLNRFMNKSNEQFISASKSFVTSSEDKSKVEIQIIQTISGSSRIMASSSSLSQGSQPGTKDVAECLEENQVTFWIGRDTTSDENVMSVSAPLYDSNNELIGVVRYVSSTAKVRRQVALMVLVCLIIGGAFVATVIISNRYFIKSIIEPVKKINVIAKEITVGRYGMRLQKIHDDEIGDLCDTINQMSEEIGRAERMKNDFISSVSHELRTPLTAIGGWSDTLIAGGATDPEEVLLGLSIIQKESSRLTQMVEELLEFTRLESGRMKLNMELFDVGAELYEAVYMYQNMLEKEHIELNYEIPEEMCIVNGDRHRMKQVFLNIIDNAAKYGKSGGKVEVRLECDSYTARISVRDWGIGIPEDELPFVKEKFYKGSSKQRGSGIGLAVTDEIVRMHSGILNITSKQGEGTCVTVSLPLAEVAPLISDEPTKIAEPAKPSDLSDTQGLTEEIPSEQ
ncbi:MAG: HAMP domain-containing sensor histidine kinase [Eubacteriales bacterium]|nr:HAMP domain-containing sensor histidine kinase [Eubacteriales bacterium]